MYSANFDYHRPTTVAEAAELLRRNPGAKVLAGGHSLLPVMKLRLATPSALVDIGGIRDMAGVRTAAAAIEIGALTTHAEVAASDTVGRGCPVLAEAAAQIGDLQVRNRGTIGGSLAHADPAADLPIVMLALEAAMIATSATGRREIAARDFFTDLFTTALDPGELLTLVRVPTYGKGTGGAYLKHRHPASSYAVVGVAVLVTLEGGTCAKVRVTIGGAAASPVRATAAEEALTGRAPDEGAVAAAAAKVPAAIPDPLGDLYASGEYRVHLATVLAKRALATAARRAGA